MATNKNIRRYKSMKKRVLCILLATLLFTGAFSLCSSAQTQRKFGDFNLSGTVDSTDALLALQTAVGKNEVPEEWFEYADVNVDSAITATDALEILQYSVGKIQIFSAEIRYNACRKLKDKIAETGEKNGKYYVENIPLAENAGFTLFYNTELDIVNATIVVISGAEDLFLLLGLDYGYIESSFGETDSDELIYYLCGYFNPTAYTASSPISYEIYDGEYNQEFVEWSRLALNDVLNLLNTYLNENSLGLTLSDFGFKSFK